MQQNHLLISWIVWQCISLELWRFYITLVNKISLISQSDQSNSLLYMTSRLTHYSSSSINHFTPTDGSPIPTPLHFEHDRMTRHRHVFCRSSCRSNYLVWQLRTLTFAWTELGKSQNSFRARERIFPAHMDSNEKELCYKCVVNSFLEQFCVWLV